MQYLTWDRNWISLMRINWKSRLNGETNACDFQCRMFLLYLYRYLIVIYVSFHGTSMSPILMAPHDYLVTFYLLPYNAKVANLIRPCIVCIGLYVACSSLRGTCNILSNDTVHKWRIRSTLIAEEKRQLLSKIPQMKSAICSLVFFWDVLFLLIYIFWKKKCYLL